MRWFPLLPLCGALVATVLGVARCETSAAAPAVAAPAGFADCPGAPGRRDAAATAAYLSRAAR